MSGRAVVALVVLWLALGCALIGGGWAIGRPGFSGWW